MQFFFRVYSYVKCQNASHHIDSPAGSPIHSLFFYFLCANAAPLIGFHFHRSTICQSGNLSTDARRMCQAMCLPATSGVKFEIAYLQSISIFCRATKDLRDLYATLWLWHTREHHELTSVCTCLYFNAEILIPINDFAV